MGRIFLVAVLFVIGAAIGHFCAVPVLIALTGLCILLGLLIFFTYERAGYPTLVLTCFAFCLCLSNSVMWIAYGITTQEPKHHFREYVLR